jgi:hypothetical protein
MVSGTHTKAGATRQMKGENMRFANENYEGIEIETQKEGIYIYPKKVGQLGIAELPFSISALQEVLAGPLKEKVFEVTGSRFYGFLSSSVGYDSNRDRVFFHIRWGDSAPSGHPVHSRPKTQSKELFISLLWEALGVLEGENAIKKRKRQVRDVFNKCKDPALIERVAEVLEKPVSMNYAQENIRCARPNTPVWVHKAPLAKLFIDGGAIAKCIRTPEGRLRPEWDIEGGYWFVAVPAKECREKYRHFQNNPGFFAPYKDVEDLMGETIIEALEASGQLD